MIRVLVADDHVVVRNGLKQLFGVMGDVALMGEAGSGEEVLVMLEHGQADLVMLDLTMPGLSGINLVARIHGLYPQLPILVLSMHNELQVAKRVLQAGATGFVTKGSEQDTLMTAIRRVSCGGRFVDPGIAEQMMFDKPQFSGAAPHERLSERELHILKLFARGRSVNEIADQLFISNKTVSTHKARLMQKLNFSSNAELVRYAADHGLIE